MPWSAAREKCGEPRCMRSAPIEAVQPARTPWTSEGACPTTASTQSLSVGNTAEGLSEMPKRRFKDWAMVQTIENIVAECASFSPLASLCGGKLSALVTGLAEGIRRNLPSWAYSCDNRACESRQSGSHQHSAGAGFLQPFVISAPHQPSTGQSRKPWNRPIPQCPGTGTSK